MKKFRLFIENFIVYGIGGVISKIVPLIMLPIVTKIMPNTEYFGISDNLNTVVSFGSALAIMGMYDAMYRMFFEKSDEEYRKQICSTTLLFTIAMSLVVSVVMVLLRQPISKIALKDKELSYVIILSAIATLVGASNSIVCAPTRMQNKKQVFLITNTLSPLISYLIAIPLLKAGYYVIALPLSAILSGLSMSIVFGVLNCKWFRIKYVNWMHLKPLLCIAIPLLPNFLLYWIFNSSDKLMITNLLGVGEAGVYAIGSKLGHCSQLIYSAFAGGWQFFSFSTMNDTNQVKTNSLVFEYLGGISYVATAFVCVLSKPIYEFFFEERYWSGYLIAPYLFFAPLLLMLYQVACNQFIVIKKTWPNMLILTVGAIINVILNAVLIPVMGIEGAAIGTLAGYAVSVIAGMIVLCQMHLMEVSKRLIFVTTLMGIFLVLWRLIFVDKLLVGILSAMIYLFVIFVAYKKDLQYLVKMIKDKG